MNLGFWKQLKRPVTALAPMSGVTDAAFRVIIARYGKPDVMWTEFVPADGLCSPGLPNLMIDLEKTEAERPIVAQIYGAKPKNFRSAAKLVAGFGFDGIDINMGCPAKPVEKKGSGAALIRKPDLARQVIEATQDGAGGLPVSVKTRIGYSDDETDTWIASLIKAQPAAIAIHARTREEKSKVPARWDTVARAAELAKELKPEAGSRPLILGNGDVASLDELNRRVDETGCDGVMVGRGIFGDPWFFNRSVNRRDLPTAQVLEVMLEHTRLYCKLFDGTKPLEMMKKHYKAYVTEFRGAGALRSQLMEAESLEEIEQITSVATGSLH